MRHQFGGPEPDNYAMHERIAHESAPRDHLGRDNKDFAIEFGEYVAKSAERLIEYLTSPGEADAEHVTDLINQARDDIYQFRKRARRASAQKPSEQRNANDK